MRRLRRWWRWLRGQPPHGRVDTITYIDADHDGPIFSRDAVLLIKRDPEDRYVWALDQPLIFDATGPSGRPEPVLADATVEDLERELAKRHKLFRT